MYKWWSTIPLLAVAVESWNFNLCKLKVWVINLWYPTPYIQTARQISFTLIIIAHIMTKILTLCIINTQIIMINKAVVEMNSLNQTHWNENIYTHKCMHNNSIKTTFASKQCMFTERSGQWNSSYQRIQTLITRIVLVKVIQTQHKSCTKLEELDHYLDK